MPVKSLTVGLRLSFGSSTYQSSLQQECWISSVTHGSPGQQNCFQSQFWMESVRKGEIGTSEEGGNLHWLSLVQQFDCVLNCLAWERLIPKESFTSTLLAHWWSSVCHRASFIAIATCLFWCGPSNLWAYRFRPADVPSLLILCSAHL